MPREIGREASSARRSPRSTDQRGGPDPGRGARRGPAGDQATRSAAPAAPPHPGDDAAAVSGSGGAAPERGRRVKPGGGAAGAPATGVARPGGLREPTHDDIAREAHLIWLERGGNDVVNWLEAEARLRGRSVDGSRDHARR
ncbi:MAG TPA: hypothetical protein PKC43_00610 [Phycisphaerales bacterium]|nr:hypothetical protein [Phycisphaerales bacterium]HMP35926.1 hypothetical protein [Phycisphaerales bacterium]